MSLTPRRLGFREMILNVLRTSRNRKRMSSAVRTTLQSIVYRKKAAAFARATETESDQLKVLPLVHQALSWVQLAENDEILASGASENVRPVIW